MNRKIKALGLAIVAAFAMSAILASASPAAQFHSPNAHTIITGTQTTAHVFTAGEGFGGISCSTAIFHGTGTALTQTEQEVEPTYSGCKDSFGRTAHVSTNGCKYNLHATGSTSPYVGDADIVCPSGKAITITVTTGGTHCHIEIKPQSNTGPVSFQNIANGDIEVKNEVTNVISFTSGGFFACGIGNGEHKGGTYTGASVSAGTDTEGNPVEITVG